MIGFWREVAEVEARRRADEDRRREEQSRGDHIWVEQHLLLVDGLTDDPVLRAVLDLHSPTLDVELREASCQTCTGDSFQDAPWPCATVKLIIEKLQESS